MFYPKQKVICLNDKPYPGRGWGDSDPPKEGEIYTVKRYFLDSEGTATLHLEEISRSDRARKEHGFDVGYGAFRFRPVVDKKTDISVFKEMLVKISEST